MEYSSNAKGNLGVALGAVGTGLGALGSTGLLSGFGGLANHAFNYVTKDELKYVQELAAKDSQIALLKSEQNTEVKIADVYERIMTRVNADARAQADWNAAQSVANAQVSAAIATNANSISALKGIIDKITITKVPNYAVCPGWGEVKVTPVAPTVTVG